MTCQYLRTFMYFYPPKNNIMEFGKSKKIFIIDDDPMLREALHDYLTRKIAHTVRLFNTGEECFEYMSEKPDVVILDYYLNTVSKDAADGMMILEQLKKYYPGIPVIMLSSQEHYGIAMQTIQKGAEHYVVKDENSFEKIASIINAI
jgi:two-component system, OmpR family, response regulator